MFTVTCKKGGGVLRLLPLHRAITLENTLLRQNIFTLLRQNIFTLLRQNIFTLLSQNIFGLNLLHFLIKMLMFFFLRFRVLSHISTYFAFLFLLLPYRFALSVLCFILVYFALFFYCICVLVLAL